MLMSTTSLPISFSFYVLQTTYYVLFLYNVSMKLIINTDGASRGNPGKAAAAWIIKDSAGNLQEKCGKSIGTTTNNVAEYLALIDALKYVLQKHRCPREGGEPGLSIESILVKSDSLLMVSQLTGKWRIKERSLQQKVMEVKKLERELGCKIIYMHVPRELNREADREANRILDEQKQ